MPFQVLEDVAVDVINGLDMSGIEDRYWRKSTNQVVSVSPVLENARFKYVRFSRLPLNLLVKIAITNMALFTDLL